jgi:hypothetical protein
MTRPDEIAIFLLSTALIAQDPNALKTADKTGRWTYNYDFYTNRSRSSMQTWGAPFPHLFVVWGNGEAEREFLGPGGRGADCPSEHFVHDGGGNGGATPIKWQLVRCHERPILFVPGCTSEYYGHNGPCCRAEAALRFVVDAGHVPLADGRGGGGDGVKWVIFADDDMFVRPAPLLALLGRHNASAPLALGGPALNSPRDAKDPRFAGGDRALQNAQLLIGFADKHTQFSAARRDRRLNNCTVACVHSFPWMMFSALTLPALRGWPVASGGSTPPAAAAEAAEGDAGPGAAAARSSSGYYGGLAPALRRGLLSALCAQLGLSHDGGVGAFVTWLHEVPFVEIDSLFVKHMGWEPPPPPETAAGGKWGGGSDAAPKPVGKRGAAERHCAAVFMHGPSQRYNAHLVAAELANCPAEDAGQAAAAVAFARGDHSEATSVAAAGANFAARFERLRAPLLLEGFGRLRATAADAPSAAAAKHAVRQDAIARFVEKPGRCSDVPLPPGVRPTDGDELTSLGLPIGRACLCDADGKPTLDGHCEADRPTSWLGLA